MSAIVATQAAVEGMAVGTEEYERIALEAGDRVWELYRGRLVEKPPMAVEHGSTQRRLYRQLDRQLDERAFVVSPGIGKVARPTAGYYVPDIFVVPADAEAALFEGPGGALEVYTVPLPFVAEVWSPSTGAHDIDRKLPEYWARGDAEIWRLHPIERTFRAWRRRENGGYDEVEFSGGIVELHGLPGVRIDLDALLARSG